MPFKFLTKPIAVGWLLALCGAAQAQTYEALLQTALQHSPAINAGYQEWQGRMQMADSSGFLPDPMVAVDFFTSPVETRTGPQQQRVMLEQKLPWRVTHQGN